VADRRPAVDEIEVLERGRRDVRALAGDRYEVAATLAVGGMSIVYRGFDHASARPVALKLLDTTRGASLEDRERFRREALISARLEHPHVVPCYEFHTRGIAALAVMRYVPGGTLAARLGRNGRMTAAELLPVLIAVSDALAHTHSQQVIHRDVTPGNILLEAGTGRPFLSDFGIATLGTSEHSRSEVVKGFGTPAFMSPEQVMGRWDADHRTDIYSLGLVAWRALAGRLPFAADSDISLAAQRTVKDVLPIRREAPEVPAALAGIIGRAVRRDPKRRWADARSLHQALVMARATITGEGQARRSLARTLARASAALGAVIASVGQPRLTS
jgi:serine/threonine-protein kinase